MTADQERDVGRAAGRVVEQLERLIVTGELLPGQPIRQELMAERFGVSRVPIREALRHLTTEGLVQHEHNVGYSVARLQQSDFDQIYLMRAALEREVLASLPDFSEDTLAEVRRHGDAVAAAAERGDVLGMRLQNQTFHFAMFEQSPLNLIVAELRRLWTLAMPYHAAYLYDPAVRKRVLAEHDQMIDALAEHDNERLIELMNLHRQGGEVSTGIMLRSAGAAAD
ncbi:transcriptional regulator, GntR family protein (plasmid) [Rhodococcus jostii RHA1]|uniref:Transcriptional regulator, GntR family protein n=1 Tax=Rhodococcus jostii (strain RHA1) TaxID=101510 RepID=Q0RXB5_RHOJR|nr:GntR family transcriptional regulator [Rhodococcus jostii]ABH00071.1 transcriptional regulator, GntR family protein [Rhodococcus jostii RHA1]